MRVIKLFLLLIIAVGSFVPNFQAINRSSEIIVVSALVWLIITIYTPTKGIELHTIKYAVMCAFFLVFTVLIPYVSGNAIIGNRYLILSIMFFFYIAYLSSKNAEGVFKIVIIPSLFLYAISSVLTLSELIKNPWISRSINTSDANTLVLLNAGIGGYSFIAFALFFSLILFGILNSYSPIKKNKYIIVLKYLMVITFLLSSSVIVASNFFTSLILLISGCILMLLGDPRKIKLGTFFNLILFVTLIIVGGFIASNIMLEDSLTFLRFEALVQSQSTSSGVNNLISGREGTSATSWITILNNPFFGLSFESYDILNDDYSIIGQHSFILDTYALFGIVPCLIGIYLIAVPFLHRIKNNKNYKIKCVSFVFLLILLIFLLINNATPSIGMAVFFIYNHFFDYIDQNHGLKS